MFNFDLEKSRGLCLLPGTIHILRSSLSGFVSFLLKSQIWFEWDLGIDSKAEFCFTQFLYKPFPRNNLYLHKIENFEIVTCSFKLKEENQIFNFRIYEQNSPSDSCTQPRFSYKIPWQWQRRPMFQILQQKGPWYSSINYLIFKIEWKSMCPFSPSVFVVIWKRC